MDKSAFANRLKMARKAARLKQKDVIEILGVGVMALSAWESAHRTPDIETVFKLAEIYQVTPSFLFTGELINDLNRSALQESISHLEAVLSNETNPVSIKIKADIIALKYSEIVHRLP